jgi:hypothetical protein
MFLLRDFWEFLLQQKLAVPGSCLPEHFSMYVKQIYSDARQIKKKIQTNGTEKKYLEKLRS